MRTKRRWQRCIYAHYSFYANPIFVNASASDTLYEQVKANLQQAVDAFDAADAKAYSAASFAAWKQAVDEARALLAQGAPDRDALTAALDKVTTAQKALAPAESGKPGTGGGTGNGGGTGTDTKKPVAVSGNGKKGNLPQTGDDADGAVATVALAGGALVVAGIAARKRLSANGK